MSGCNTELAKNLILAGANITIVDAEVIKEVDIDTNFLFTKDVIGKKVLYYLDYYFREVKKLKKNFYL